MTNVHEMLNYKGKTVLVTGGASGMGVGIAKRFAEAGANVYFTYNSHGDKAEGVRQELLQLGVKAECGPLDQGDPESCRKAIDDAFEKMGQVDFLVNNGGLHGGTPSMDLDQATWDRVLNCNLRGVFFCSQFFAKKLMEKDKPGAIVNISSINSVNPLDGALHYGASKAGVNMVTRCLAKDLGPHNIRVNAIAPGLMDSPFLDVNVPGWRERFIDRAPLGKPGQPADIGNIALFLTSEMASWITGQVIVADGGVTLAAAY